MPSQLNLLCLAAGIALLSACASEQPRGINDAAWLIGTWENKTPEGSVYETWRKKNDHEYWGTSYLLKGKDTVVLESLRLVEEQDGLFYIPTVADQNNGQPVRFDCKTNSGSEITFENPRHDFPQLISYKKLNNDALVAKISGLENGQKHEQSFPMQRVN